ncbi:glycoside hydrolase family 2 TIM barrel-domain containing protein [Nibricoccus sp. IMCC34717]|uniref:glycoside hydrolase family 2 TIM barrel-domain containing protein n=1 Tax=Nibricoccus sp. IMCC34717 TaxID=3034021 RepID=UPI00384BDE32
MTRLRLLGAALAAAALHLNLLAQAPLPPELENTECLGIAKEPAHATLMPYGSLDEAFRAKRSESSLRQSLNGTWKFNWVREPSLRPVDFYRPDFDVSAWKDLPVPSNWQVHGYGTPFYRNLGYTIQKDWPRIMSEPPRNFTAYVERNPVGSYRRDFEVPKSWDGRRVFLSFDGVDSAFFVWINGTRVGYSVNSRNVAEFDVTRFLKAGRNTLAVEVYQYSSGTWLEDQDKFRLSGIFRDVYLWSAPNVHIRDFHARVDLDEEYTDGSVSIEAKVRNYGNALAPARLIEATLQGLPGAKATASVPALKPGEEAKVLIEVSATNPAKWTAETPNLHTLVLQLRDSATAPATEILSQRIGFRKLEVRGRQVLINGTPIKLKGVNRHEHWPEVGHAITEQHMIADLKLIKQANSNHIRTSHYSNSPRWYELCDEFGIYLVAEANIESHGYMGRFIDEPLMRKAMVDRNVANTENFKNHPSVIIWSLGNETGGIGSNFTACIEAIRAIDKNRPIHYEGFGIGTDNPADVDSQMYASVDNVERIANDPKRTKPYYLCEYAHAMFNSMGSIADYNDLFDKYPALLGGAVWEWQDQGLWNRRDPQRPILAYGGGFGEYPNDHYFIHKGVVFSERGHKPHYPEMKRAYQWISTELVAGTQDTVRVKNRYAFIDLSHFQGHWRITEDGVAIQSGELQGLAVPAGAAAEVKLPLKPIDRKAGALYQVEVWFTLKENSVWADAGFEIARNQTELPGSVAASAPNRGATGTLQVTSSDSGVVVAGPGFSVAFDRASAAIQQITQGGKDILLPGAGPKLHLWRAPHRLDDMWAYVLWTHYGVDALKTTVESFSQRVAAPGEVIVEATLNHVGLRGFAVREQTIYHVYSDGSVLVDTALTPTGRRIPLGRVGVRLELPLAADHVTYLGRGPLENYSDRKRGSDIGLFASSVSDLVTPYEKPMENGNHEDVRWLSVGGQGRPVLLVQAVDGAMQFSAQLHRDEVMTPVEYRIDLPKPESTVLTLASRTLGVGSAGCGPRPLEQYQVWSDPVAYSYALRALPEGTSDVAGIARQGFAADRTRPLPLPGSEHPKPLRVKEVEVSSAESWEGQGWHLIDNQDHTPWRNRTSTPASKLPQFAVLDYGKSMALTTINCVKCIDSDQGQVKDFEVFVSEDGKSWTPALRGTLEVGRNQQQVPLPAGTRGRFLKFVVASVHDGGDALAIAELETFGSD